MLDHSGYLLGSIELLGTIRNPTITIFMIFILGWRTHGRVAGQVLDISNKKGELQHGGNAQRYNLNTK